MDANEEYVRRRWLVAVCEWHAQNHCWITSSLELSALIERIGLAERKFEEHTKHVSRFLTEMYQTMIDPLDDSGLKVAELCELLLHQAREDREKLNRSPANLPADWNRDSSLETWFPLTAEELKRKTEQIAALTAQLHDAEAERDRMRELIETLRTIPAIQHMAVLATKEKKARAALSGVGSDTKETRG